MAPELEGSSSRPKEHARSNGALNVSEQTDFLAVERC